MSRSPTPDRAGRAPERPFWSEAIRALRDVRGVTREGWAAALGYSAKTVQRWESGGTVPDAEAEAALLRLCRERGIFGALAGWPLRGAVLTPELLGELLARARLGADGPPPTVPSALPPRSPSLPVPLTTFVGRRDDLAAVERLLERRRLVTLTGMGGAGKTRLALEVASTRTEPVHLVDLSAPRDDTLLPAAVAAALGVAEQRGRPLLDTLAAMLSTPARLLLLDNCEHLVSACADLVSALLGACPDLRVLATSRAALRAPGEAVYRLAGLALPDSLHLPLPAEAGRAVDRLRGQASPRPFSHSPLGDTAVAAADTIHSHALSGPLHLAPAEPAPAGQEEGAGRLSGSLHRSPLAALVQSDAVRLFVERATLVQPGFALTEENAPAVVAICRQLDGLPLALELAAARLAILAPEQIATRLGDRFRLLTGGSRTVRARQQTLRAALDWSHDLLAEEERVLLRRLAVFAGGWTLDAAEAVCADPPSAPDRLPAGPGSFTDNLPAEHVLDLLARLHEQSMVVSDAPLPGAGDEQRYRLLETVRAYALERLDRSADAAPVRARLQAWAFALAEQAAPRLTGQDQATWLRRLAAEHDNLRAALTWSFTRPDAAAGARLTFALWRYWEARGHLGEGRGWLERALAMADGVRPLLCSRLANAAGNLARHQGDMEAARAHFELALSLAREVDARPEMAAPLNNLGDLAMGRGDYAAARQLFRDSLALRPPTGEERETARTLQNLGAIAHMTGDLDTARHYYTESLAAKRRVGDLPGIAGTLTNLGLIALMRREVAVAASPLEEALAIYGDLADARRAAHARQALAELAYLSGDHGRARALLLECLAVYGEVGNRVGAAECVQRLATLAFQGGDAGHAARLAGAAEALRAGAGAPLPPAARAEVEAEVARVRESLPEAEFAALWNTGEAMTLEQAIASARGAVGDRGV